MAGNLNDSGIEGGLDMPMQDDTFSIHSQPGEEEGRVGERIKSVLLGMKTTPSFSANQKATLSKNTRIRDDLQHEVSLEPKDLLIYHENVTTRSQKNKAAKQLGIISMHPQAKRTLRKEERLKPEWLRRDELQGTDSKCQPRRATGVTEEIKT